MQKNLVIVESPAKAKTIEKFLGADYLVKSSFGHIRDLEEKNIGIDFKNNYQPVYEVAPDKKKLVAELKKLSSQAETVWLASDEDREGEAISWHLSEVLKLPKAKTRRIVFHEITKEAILRAIETPRDIDIHLVDAQQARRVLDRIVGFELSPVLWRKVKPSLSAGRVQSVAVRLIVDREREIRRFNIESSYRVTAVFLLSDGTELKAELQSRFKTKPEVFSFLEQCRNASFGIENIVTKPLKRSPAAPFTTSTLQQEASRKLGFSVAQTMMVAQRLYESGQITYMRTDSVNLSDLALNTSRAEILSMAGERYLHTRRFQTKSKGAQEAHEAIRPTYMNQHAATGDAQEKRLYDLIWKRTIASQMSDAEIEKTTVTIGISTENEYKFIAEGEVLKFDGFLRVYIESTDDESEEKDESLLPPLKVGETLALQQAVAQERFTQHPPRYTEASLVRKMEELGIGRPSTYAPTISTIQNRSYIEKTDREGETRHYNLLTLKNGAIVDETKQENFGAEKAKLFPTSIGMVVNDFLADSFPEILNYNFTADVEKEFDEVAEGVVEWTKMIDDFYKKFHPVVENVLETTGRKAGERELGTDPKSGKRVSVKVGRFGPVVQIGMVEDEEKPTFASLKKTQYIDTITLEEALELFKMPRSLGEAEGKTLKIGIGRFGPYIQLDKFYSLPKEYNPETITLEESLAVIERKREEERNKFIKQLGDDNEYQVLNGRFGPYIAFKAKNYKIPKTITPADLTLEQCQGIVAGEIKPEVKKKTAAKKKTATKKK